jgi:hypothetical protein
MVQEDRHGIDVDGEINATGGRFATRMAFVRGESSLIDRSCDLRGVEEGGRERECVVAECSETRLQ